MPNVKGGKGYKKGKGPREAEFVEAEEGQLYARVTKILGSCNLIVYCNDNYKRLAHIRGKLRKRAWMNVGDIVLVTTRDFEERPAEDLDPTAGKLEKCDVIAKYDHDMWGKLKKLDGFNQRLLIDVERVDQNISAAELETKLKHEEEEEDIFDRPTGSDEEDEDVDPDEDPEVAAARKEAMKKRSEKKRMAIQGARSLKMKEIDVDNINIDAI